MDTGMVSAFGMYTAVDMAWGVDVSMFDPGFGKYMGAMLDGVGVPGSAQLERINAHIIRTRTL